MCIDLNYPHFRFANKFVATDPAVGKIRVEVVYPKLAYPEWTDVIEFDGKNSQLAGAGNWRLSHDVDLKPDFGGQVPGARYVALRFTALKTGACPGVALACRRHLDRSPDALLAMA